MDSDNTQSEEVLYRDQFAKVTATWFTNQTPSNPHRKVSRLSFFELVAPPTLQKTSYAISTLMRLSFIESIEPPFRSLLLFFFSLGLVFFSALYLVRDLVPTAVAGAMLAVSLFVWSRATWLAFMKKPVYQIKAFFVDGTVVDIKRQKQEQAYGLYRALDNAKSGFVSSEVQSEELEDPSDDAADDYIPLEVDAEDGARENALRRKMHRLKTVFAIMSRSRNRHQ